MTYQARIVPITTDENGNYFPYGAGVPQHRLLSRREWEHLRTRVWQLTYWSTLGNDRSSPHHCPVVLRRDKYFPER